jgi:hypothetical protein
MPSSKANYPQKIFDTVCFTRCRTVVFHIVLTGWLLQSFSSGSWILQYSPGRFVHVLHPSGRVAQKLSGLLNLCICFSLKIAENDVKDIVCFEGSVKCTTFGRLVKVAPLYTKSIIHLFDYIAVAKKALFKLGFQVGVVKLGWSMLWCSSRCRNPRGSAGIPPSPGFSGLSDCPSPETLQENAPSTAHVL